MITLVCTYKLSVTQFQLLNKSQHPVHPTLHPVKIVKHKTTFNLVQIKLFISIGLTFFTPMNQLIAFYQWAGEWDHLYDVLIGLQARQDSVHL